MITKPSHSITFEVDNVEPAAAALPECKTYEAVERLLRSPIESCCDYHSSVLADVPYHAMLAAVYIAYCDHRPLVLGPDAVWLTIEQGIANHMVHHAERLRDRFVSHDDRLPLEVTLEGFVKGSPENPWRDAFAGWASQIRRHVGEDLHDRLVCDFSTTGPTERAVSQIVMMDVFERYFKFVAGGICGIPRVTLEGTPADWERLRAKLACLERFDLHWWTPHLTPICDEFVNAAHGNINLPHWQSICKRTEAYGGDIINGWIAKLFPYLGKQRTLNPAFEQDGGFKTSAAPPSLSCVPFTWQPSPCEDRRYAMEAIGGFVGVEQDTQTKALRAKIGWAVRDETLAEVLFRSLKEDHVLLAPTGEAQTESSHAEWAHDTVPDDLYVFYRRAGGAEIHAINGRPRYRILPRHELNDLWTPPKYRDRRDCVDRPGYCREWFRFCDLSDGRFLVIDSERLIKQPPHLFAKFKALEAELQPKIEDELSRWKLTCPADLVEFNLQWKRRRLLEESPVLRKLNEQALAAQHAGRYQSNRIILCEPGSIGVPGKCPVVAESFTEFLKLAIEHGEQYWWDLPDWHGVDALPPGEK